ncbi:FecR domain-containing protein [Planctomycetota bacterium]
MNVDHERLISLYFLDHTAMTEDEAEQLSAWLKEDIAHVRVFIRAGLLHREIHNRFSTADLVKKDLLQERVQDSGSGIFEGHMDDSDVWNALLYVERTSPTIAPIQSPKEGKKPVPKKNVEKNGSINRLRLYTIIATSAALLLILLLPFVVTPCKEAATLVDSMDAVWIKPSTPPAIGQRLRTGKSLQIEKGIVKLELDDGTRMIVEAPATFQLADTNQVTLHNGHFSAWVPERALGFTAMTPTSRIVDLGTEFGVEVRDDGTARTHMFDGKASIAATQQNRSGGQSSLLSRGQAKQTDFTGTMSDIAFEGTRFVRQMDSSQGSVWRGETIDLVDVYWGGDGLGNGAGELPVLMSSPLMELPAVMTEQTLTNVFEPNVQASDPCYFAVPHPCVDGVFIPDGGNGAVQVSSLGHTYDCPDTRGVTWKLAYSLETTNITFWDRDRNGLWDRVEHEGPSNDKYVVLHSNMGLTFDLNALGRIFAKTRVAEFKAYIGIARHPWSSKHIEDIDLNLDITILEDGQERLSIKGIRVTDEPRELSLPLEPGSRFLTFMVTEGEDKSIDFDYGIFSDAHLVLKQVER